MIKAKVSFLLLSSAFLTGVANAQTTAKPAGTATTAEASASSDEAQSPSATAAGMPAALPAATSSTTLEKVAGKRPYKLAFLTAAFSGMQSTNEGKGTVTALNQLRAEYKLDDTQKLRVNQVFTNEMGVDAKSENAFQLGDMYLQYSKSKLAELIGDLKLNTATRIYLPFSESSRERNQIGSLRLDVEFAKNLNKTFDIALHVIPWVSGQSTSSYVSKGVRKANSPVNLAYYLSGSANITEKFSFVQEAGLMHYWYNADAANGIDAKQKDFLYLDSSVTYTISDNFDVGVGLSSYLGRDLLAQNSQFGMYRSDETDYYLTGSASF